MMGQAKKPTIMVVPSDAWCNAEGYVQEYDELGTKKTMADYQAALQNSMELKLVSVRSMSSWLIEDSLSRTLRLL
jgi:hypothetical protein